MSHMAVAVITKEPPTNDVLHKHLQPFHDFGCTGINDEYVQDINVTDAYREEFNNATRTFYKSPDGKLYNPYMDMFYRDPTDEESEKIGSGYGSGCVGDISYIRKEWNGGEYRPKVHYLPDGFTEVKLMCKDIMPFPNWLQDSCGLRPLFENEVPDLTESDNHKYGWYRVNLNGDVIEVIERTNPNAQWDWWVIGGRYANRLYSKSAKNWCDYAIKSDIDWELMYKENEKYMNENSDKLDESAAKIAYALTVFAYIKDGKWYEKGNMGWWGVVTDEDNDWYHNLKTMFEELPDDTWITIVDCHI